MMRILSTLLLPSILAVAAVSQSTPAPPQFAPVTGTHVSMVPPAGFTPAIQFPGFVEESMGASIMVTEFPGPITEATAVFNDREAMASKGMELLDQQAVKISNLTGALYRIKQVVSGVELRKWLLVFGDKESVLITATFPQTFENDLSERVKASILTVKWERDKKLSATEGLNFSITESGDLRLAKRVASSLLYTRNGVFTTKVVDEPLFVISPSLASVHIDNGEQFAKLRLYQTATVKDIRVVSLTQITIDGFNGYEISATGADSESGTPMLLYQVLIYDAQTYYLMQGLVSSKGALTYEPVFKAMAMSFKLKRVR
jgi:hypothetical protein